MKFLVLALCVCAASAATFSYKPSSVQGAAKFAASPFAAAQAVASSNSGYVAPVVVAKTASSDAQAEVVSNVADILPDGSFNQHYETNNGISVSSTGVLKKVGDHDALVVSGSYKYYAADGTPVVVSYVADENGYQPQSDLLPVAPPVPEDIARAVAYVLKNAKPEEYKKY